MYQKGQSGNPHGRPRKTESLTDILKELGEKNKIIIDGKKIKWKKALMLKLWALALKGDKAAMTQIYDRIEGKPREMNTHEISGSNGGPIQLLMTDLLKSEKIDGK